MLETQETIWSRGVDRASDSDLIEFISGETPRLTLLSYLERAGSHTCAEQQQLDFGLGNADRLVIAALELGRRCFGCRGKRVRSAQDAFPLLQHYADHPQEQFVTLTLNGAHEVIASRVVTVGLVNRTLSHPREVFADAITDRAVSIIIAHNHPSGQLEPSDEDKEATRRLYEAGRILGIALLDHLILGPQGKYLSFIESGLSLY